jgi:hypothetical protein
MTAGGDESGGGSAFEDLVDDMLTRLCDRIREKSGNEKLRHIVFPIPSFLLSYVYAIIAFGTVSIAISSACLFVLLVLLQRTRAPPG